MNNAIQAVFFMRKIGKEIWENGELSSNSKSILRSISISDIRKYREQFQQMAFQQLRRQANTPERQELLNALINFSQAFSGDVDYFIKECLDILYNNKGNSIINKLLSHISQQINSYVSVEDTSEIDDATYQQMRLGFEQIANYIQEKLRNHRFTKEDEKIGKEILQNLNAEDIQAIREVLRKFALKAIDTETEIYTQVPTAWRTEIKLFLKSLVNLFAGILDENLLYDCLQIGLNEGINDQEKRSKLSKILVQQLNRWSAQKKFYVKGSFSRSTKFNALNWTQKLTTQMNHDGNYQIQQLKEEISQLQQRIKDLEREKQGQNPIQRESMNGELKELQRMIKERETKQENLQSQESKQKKQLNFRLINFGDSVGQQELDKFAQRMEKFDKENKWTGGKIALVAISCFLGGGLVVFLLWLAFRKKKS